MSRAKRSRTPEAAVNPYNHALYPFDRIGEHRHGLGTSYRAVWGAIGITRLLEQDDLLRGCWYAAADELASEVPALSESLRGWLMMALSVCLDTAVAFHELECDKAERDG